MSLNLIYEILSLLVTLFTVFDIAIIFGLCYNEKIMNMVAKYFRESVILFVATLMLWCAFVLLGIYMKNN